MTLKSFRNFCKKYNYQLQLLETTTIIIIALMLLFVVAQHFFLQYKVVLVEQDSFGDYEIVKEIIVNGQITDSLYTIDTSITGHNSPFKYNITNQNRNNDFLYNIST